MSSLKIGKKEVLRVLGSTERYYLIHNHKGETTGETTDLDIYSYHRRSKKDEQEALKRVEHVLGKMKDRVLTRPRQ
jgi:hypothetical protein